MRSSRPRFRWDRFRWGLPLINPLSMLGDIHPAMHQVHVPLTGALREYTLE